MKTKMLQTGIKRCRKLLLLIKKNNDNVGSMFDINRGFALGYLQALKDVQKDKTLELKGEREYNRLRTKADEEEYESLGSQRKPNYGDEYMEEEQEDDDLKTIIGKDMQKN